MTLTAPLDIRVDIAPDVDPDSDPATWTWLDVSSYRRQKTEIALNTGRDDESEDVEPADSSLLFNLRDGYLSPRNPNSTLYKRIGQNTPIRYRLGIFSDTFTRTVAGGLGTSTSGDTWSGSASYSVNGSAAVATLAAANSAIESTVTTAGAADIDIVYSVTIGVLTTGAPWISAMNVRRIDSANLYRVHTELKPAGEVYLKITQVAAGSQTDLDDEAAVATYTAGNKVWTHIQAIGGTIRARAWVGSTEPTTWHVSTTQATRVEGAGFGFYQWRFFGNTNVGSLSVQLDDMVAQAILWGGNVPEWNPRWDKSGNDSTVPIGAAGPIRKLAQGEDTLKSPLTRQLPRYSPGGYWPLEDGTDATAAGSALTGGRSAKSVGVTFGDSDHPAGASGAAVFGSASAYMRGVVTGNTGSNWSGMFFLKLPSLPATNETMMEWRSNTGTLRRWVISAENTGFRLFVYKDDGTLASSAIAGAYVDAPTQWTAVQLEVVQSGGNVNVALIWNRTGTGVFWPATGTIAGTVGPLSEFYIPPTAILNGARFSQIWAGPESLPFVDTTFIAVSGGYAGELASARISRLCAEQGVTVSVTAGTSEALGVQRAGKFLDLLRESARADMGILYERGFGLAYVPRAARYNGAVKMTLDWTGGDLAEAPEPTDDDQRLFNQWTVSRTGGSEATYKNAASASRHGTVSNSTEINISTDSRLTWHAMWRTSLTTVDELRWPLIEIDLLANPSLVPSFLNLRPGARIRVTNPKDQLPGITIDLIVEGITQDIGRHRWRAALNCSPASPWQVGTWGTGLWSSASTSLPSQVLAGVTSFNISTVSRWETWSTSASGYQWDLAGETVTVQTVGAATGSGPYTQAVTVLRAQNGVSKIIPAGTVPRLLGAGKWAL